eukprot:CAMPEP_0168611956 /NCGR_PEP_ID=MMETSP0449_2-20121227/2645_1 /TAXON_ID=1082188 /ORGANISM="Strombidium rassoulzadegani, Strain ras09" /LENGTH=92 /DNA_ID=CAMNT_0008652459 /DNA_START=498 /DNA_END=776 /DNA_ORIENTATION=+
MSKCLQEKEVIDYLSAKKASNGGVLPEGTPEIVRLHPSLILGPVLHKDTMQSTAGIVKFIANGKIPFLPNIHTPTIDVRECALAHVLALEAE